MYDEEKEYLEYALKRIKMEIEKSNKTLADLHKTGISLSFEDRKRGDHLNINALADDVDRRIKTLENSLPTPYFGRMDISFDDNANDLKKIYIGRNGISSENQSIVIDWRAPVSSIYYDSEVGPVEYEAPEGIIKGNLDLKRQINIKNSQLIDVQDSDLVTNDDLLKPYLSVNADNKMKNIVASIQKEQNSIIRKSPHDSIIVQGVAGSGKTSVALHRVAYLIYELRNKVSSSQFVVLGPNNYFLDYISSILPELETSPINQETLFDFSKKYIGEKISLKKEQVIDKNVKDLDLIKNIQSFKTSLEYKELLDSFITNYLNCIVRDDFMVNGEKIFDKEKVMKYLFLLDSSSPNYDKASQLLTKDLQENLYSIYDSINKKYKDIYTSSECSDEERKKYVKQSSDLYKELKNNGKKLVKKYVKGLKKSPIELYKMFILNLNFDDLSLSEKELLLLQKETLLDLKKKKIAFEDIPALLHISYLTSKKTLDYKYLVVDEAQDYGMFHFFALKEINPNGNFAIYGDLAQAIYSYRSIDSWDKLNYEVFNDKCDVMQLSKSYRTTIEITNNANAILDYVGLKLAEPVIRHGTVVEYSNNANNLKFKIDKINELKEEGFVTIAIICKTDKEASKLNKELLANGINSKYIEEKSDEYVGDILVLTSAAAKGLEFDTVIINDASSNVYSVLSDVDMHLLYVASTRALHKMFILYNKELVSVYQKFLLPLEKEKSSKQLKRIKNTKL